MTMRIFLVGLAVICLNSCVKSPAIKDGNYALLRSSHAIVSINGEHAEPVYSLDLKSGENTLVVLYRSYQQDYYCKFVWTSASGTVYEITDHEKRYPLTLYRWIRKNSLWSIRMDPVDPVECSPVKMKP